MEKIKVVQYGCASNSKIYYSLKFREENTFQTA